MKIPSAAAVEIPLSCGDLTSREDPTSSGDPTNCGDPTSHGERTSRRGPTSRVDLDSRGNPTGILAAIVQATDNMRFLYPAFCLEEHSISSSILSHLKPWLAILPQHSYPWLSAAYVYVAQENVRRLTH